MNSGKPDHLPPASCFLDLNWDGPAEISPHMNCPPEFQPPVRQLAPFSADPAFVERAARLSCFGGGGGGNYGGLAGQLGVRESGKLLRVSSCKSLRVNRPQLEVGNAAAESSAAVSDPISAGDGESNARKRKAAPKGKSKDTTKSGDEEYLSAKRCRSVEEGEIKPKMEQNGGASSSSGGRGGKESNVKPPEPQKDYIHVRARRGQATDNHSLAERVRREKISVRMKLLQDLVPGCNKVTGKALMLDEIINYVQSLQRQVEFLSMKLATVNPRLDFNGESILTKDMHLSNGSMLHSGNPMEASEAGFQYTHPPLMTNALESQFLLNTLEPALHRTLSMQLHALEGFGDAASQLESFWENDLQNVVQMGFGQGQEFALHDQLPADHMKIEL